MKLFLGGKQLLPSSTQNHDTDDDDVGSTSGRARKLSAGDLIASAAGALSKIPLVSTQSERKYKTLARLQSEKESMRDINGVALTATGELLGLKIHVKIPYTRVGATRSGKIYTQYVMQNELPPPTGSAPNTPSKEWMVNRRYSQFVDLDKQLRQLVPKRDLGKLTSLPPKRYLNSFEDAVIVERKRGLSDYISAAFKAVVNNEAASAVLAVFLQMPGSPPLRSVDEEDRASSGTNAAGIKGLFPKESTAQTVTTSDGLEAHHGFLWKRGGLYQQKPFKMSFCVLNFDEAVFRFYRTSRPQLLGAVQLKDQKDAFVQEIPSGEYGIPEEGFGLRLFTPERELIMYAETREDRDSWVQALARCLPGSSNFTPKRLETIASSLGKDDKSASRGDDDGDAHNRDVSPQRLGSTSSPPQRKTTPSPVSMQKKPAKGPIMTTPQEKAERELELIQSIREDWAIDWKDVEVLEKIGGGAFGTVYKGKCWGTIVAVKQLNTSGPITPELKLIMQKEVGVLSRLRHPNVVLYLGASYDEGVAAMITEWCPRKSLFDLMQCSDRKSIDFTFNAELMLKIGLQIAQGMCYLHSRKEQIIHRDLKSLNVLMTDGFDAKVADFGLTVMREATVTGQNTHQSLARKDRYDSFRSQPAASVLSNSGADFFGTEGTAQWMAPEVMEGARYNFKVDVYSYGILLTEILTRKMPFKDLYKGFDFVDAVVDRAERPTIPTWALIGGAADVHDDEDLTTNSTVSSNGDNAAPSALGDLVAWCLNRDPELRPNFRQVIQKLETICTNNSPNDLLAKFDLPRLREMLDIGVVDDVIHAGLELLSLLHSAINNVQPLPHKRAALQKFTATSNIAQVIFSRIADGQASRVVENGGDYVRVDIPLETMVDLVSCIRLLVSPALGVDPSPIFQLMHFPKRDPLEAVAALFLRPELDHRGVEACGSLLSEFRMHSTKLKAVLEETMEAKIDEAFDDKRNPLNSGANAARRRTMVVTQKEQILWRCKAFDLLPNKHAKKGIIGSTKDDSKTLEADIRALEVALALKRRTLLDGTQRDVSRDVGKV